MTGEREHTERTECQEHDSWGRTAGTENHGRKTGTASLRTPETGQPEQVGLTDHPGQVSLPRKKTKEDQNMTAWTGHP